MSDLVLGFILGVVLTVIGSVLLSMYRGLVDEVFELRKKRDSLVTDIDEYNRFVEWKRENNEC